MPDRMKRACCGGEGTEWWVDMMEDRADLQSAQTCHRVLLEQSCTRLLFVVLCLLEIDAKAVWQLTALRIELWLHQNVTCHGQTEKCNSINCAMLLTSIVHSRTNAILSDH